MDFIKDFCKYCQKFSYLERMVIQGLDCYEWFKWSEVIDVELYDSKFLGVKIDLDKVKEIDENASQDYDFKIINTLGKKQSRDIKKLIECQICKDDIDKEANLMCISCSTTWWFNCILRWLLTDERWPNCKTELNSEKLAKNLWLRNLVEKLYSLVPKTSANVWNEHQEASQMYCKDCKISIWFKWVCENLHCNHKIESNEQRVKSLKLEAQSINTNWDKLINEIKINNETHEAILTINQVACNRAWKKLENYIEESKSLMTSEISQIYQPLSTETLESVKKSVEQTRILKSFQDAENSANLDEINKVVTQGNEAICNLKKDNVSSIMEEFSKRGFVTIKQAPTIIVKDTLAGVTFDNKYWIPLSKEKLTAVAIINHENSDKAKLKISLESMESLEHVYYWKVVFSIHCEEEEQSHHMDLRFAWHSESAAVSTKSFPKGVVHNVSKLAIQFTLWDLTDEVNNLTKKQTLKVKEDIKKIFN